MKRALPFLLLVMLPAAIGAQIPATPPSSSVANVEVDPIRCWWRTSAGAIRTGETFDLSLTCATLENDAVQVVPDESRLGVAVVQMAPFEVVGGSHPADLRSGSRRFFQYQYTLRIINPDAIGRDIKLPDLTLHYRVNSHVSATAAVQGRDLAYLLPSQTIRVASMVPTDATDIRDVPGENFGIVDALEFKAGALEIAAMTCVALGGLMTLLVLIRLARGARGGKPAHELPLPPRRLLRAAASELARVQREREQHGWTDALAGRALTAIRIAAACAIGRPVSQRPAEAGVTEGEGRLIATGSLRGKPRIVSSPMTAEDLVRDLAIRPASDTDRRQTLDDLRAALAAFSKVQYGRETAMDQSALDGTLSGAISAVARIKSDHTWVKEALRRRRVGPVVESRA